MGAKSSKDVSAVSPEEFSQLHQTFHQLLVRDMKTFKEAGICDRIGVLLKNKDISEFQKILKFHTNLTDEDISYYTKNGLKYHQMSFEDIQKEGASNTSRLSNVSKNANAAFQGDVVKISEKIRQDMKELTKHKLIIKMVHAQMMSNLGVIKEKLKKYTFCKYDVPMNAQVVPQSTVTNARQNARPNPPSNVVGVGGKKASKRHQAPVSKPKSRTKTLMKLK